MNALMVAAGLSVLAAATHAATAVVQERLAARPSIVIPEVVRSARWWVAVGLASSAALLHVAALRFGPLTVVQPLSALTLVLALPLGAAVAGRQVGPSEWRGAALTVIGLGGLLLLTASGKPTQALRAGEVAVVTGVALAILAILVINATLAPGRIARSLLYAVAAGVSFGVSSALTQTVVVRMSIHGWEALVSPAAVIVLGLAAGGLLLAQAAYRGGLGAPLAVLTLVNPIVAAIIGVTLLGERYVAGGLGAALAVVAAMIAAHGVITLAQPAAVRVAEAART